MLQLRRKRPHIRELRKQNIAKECPEKGLCEKVEATNMCKVSSAHAFMCITVEANNTNTNRHRKQIQFGYRYHV